MNTQFYRADDRGDVDMGWLKSKHTFSFGSYHHPDKNGFGELLVINDDRVMGGKGFGTHPHGQMEIISIPLKGALAHADSQGGSGIIKTGDVQVMSAGKGIAHSEYNASQEEEVHFLQIWIKPDTRNVEPRYEQESYDLEQNINNWVNVVSPWESPEPGLRIHQKAYMDLMITDSEQELTLKPRIDGNGLFLFSLQGSVTGLEQPLGERDAVALSHLQDPIKVKIAANSKVLLIEVPPDRRGRF